MESPGPWRGRHSLASPSVSSAPISARASPESSRAAPSSRPYAPGPAGVSRAHSGRCGKRSSARRCSSGSSGSWGVATGDRSFRWSRSPDARARRRARAGSRTRPHAPPSMCGIFGIASLDRAPVAGLSARLSTLRDRGPDNVGEARFDHVALFHTRLAVIDAKEMSNQPLRGDGIALVCNGEILNHSDLREEGGSYRYLTPSDCEAVIDVYARLGIEGFGRLDGFFAFALFDSRREVLILHRDNVGKKPLFWTSDGRRVLLGSNVTTLLENLELTPPVDRGQIPFLLRNGFVDPRASLFHGIRPVLPGQVVEIDLRTGRIAERRLDKPWRRYDGFDWKDERLVQRTIEELLHDSCAKRARGLRAPVLILSGGVDSTVLAHELVKLS